MVEDEARAWATRNSGTRAERGLMASFEITSPRRPRGPTGGTGGFGRRPPPRGSNSGSNSGGNPEGSPGHSPNFVALWLVVSILWTVATILRMQRTWPPGRGWVATVSDAFTWISLLAPPLIFALVLFAMSRVTRRLGR